MEVEGTHSVVVGDWLVDVDITHFDPGSPPDMSYDSVDPGCDGEIVFDMLSAAAVRKERGGDPDQLSREAIEYAIYEQLIVCH